MVTINVKESILTDKFAKSFGLHPAIIQAIINRGYTTEKEIETYLFRDKQPYGDPHSINDMAKAVTLLVDAIETNKKILVFGDTDCDGVIGTSVLLLGLRILTKNVSFMLTNRNKGGAYGLGEDSAARILEEQPDVVITVDNGTTSVNGIKLLKDKGITVIVTDHHEPLAEKVDADVVVNPKVNNSPLQDLCGAGVAWYLLKALSEKMTKLKPDTYLDLVTVATVGDVVPLVGPNRRIVYDGLKNIHKTKNKGLSLLFKQKALYKDIDSGDLAFKIVPMINAFGRVGDPADGVCLFTGDKADEAVMLAMQAKNSNDIRKEIESGIYKEAMLKLAKGSLTDCIVVYDPGWDDRIVGIVASRLAQRYKRPAFVMTKVTDPATGEEYIKGSCRSVDGIDIIMMLTTVDANLRSYGGHKMAAGLTLHEKDFGTFAVAINEVIAQVKSMSTVEIPVDAQVAVSSIDWKFIEQQENMQPFGHSNKEPVFVFKEVKITDTRILGTCHLSCYINDFNGGKVKAIMFNSSYTRAPASLVDVVGTVKISKWRGSKEIQILIKEIIEIE